MTNWIMPEYDREGWAVCLFWLQGGKHIETPTDKKNLSVRDPPWGTFGPPFSNKAYRPNAHLFYIVINYNGNFTLLF